MIWVSSKGHYSTHYAWCATETNRSEMCDMFMVFWKTDIISILNISEDRIMAKETNKQTKMITRSFLWESLPAFILPLWTPPGISVRDVSNRSSHRKVMEVCLQENSVGLVHITFAPISLSETRQLNTLLLQGKLEAVDWFVPRKKRDEIL